MRPKSDERSAMHKDDRAPASTLWQKTGNDAACPTAGSSAIAGSRFTVRFEWRLTSMKEQSPRSRKRKPGPGFGIFRIGLGEGLTPAPCSRRLDRRLLPGRQGLRRSGGSVTRPTSIVSFSSRFLRVVRRRAMQNSRRPCGRSPNGSER